MLEISTDLPPRLESPADQANAFAALGLRDTVLRAIVDAGYTIPTPIQERAIPLVLARRDVVGIAQTGTGKTASFVLPMLHVLSAGRARARMPRSLILSPTRELATQTARNFEIYGRYLSLTMALLIGGVGMGDQEKLLEKGVDVLIATPGRLIDWFERGRVMLGGVDILVIDEADRMFDMGFMPDVEKIVSKLSGRKQTLLFSATMPPEVRRLADRFLVDPAEIRVAAPTTTAPLVDDVVVDVAHDTKKRALVDLIRSQAVPKAIVFCNRKRDIGGVMRHLQQAGLHARDLHGDLEQVHRQQTLDQFTRGEVDFLVATDVAARGLDISDMPVVINYDVPINPEDYIHRIGRTGRAGRKGRAFTFAGGEDRKALVNIERLTKREIPRIRADGAPLASDPTIVDVEAAEPRAGRSRGGRSGRPGPSREARGEVPNARGRAAAAAVANGEVPSIPPPASPERPFEVAEPVRLEAEPPKRVDQARHEVTTRSRGAQAPAAAIVGFGDHVPAFLLRPVPARPIKEDVDEA